MLQGFLFPATAEVAGSTELEQHWEKLSLLPLFLLHVLQGDSSLWISYCHVWEFYSEEDHKANLGQDHSGTYM